MIFHSSGSFAEILVLPRGAGRSTPMMAFDQSTFPCRAILFLFVLVGIPSAARASNLDDSARELARKIAALLPAGQNIASEVRNASSLQASDVARIEQAFKVELQERGVGLSATGDKATVVLITLSENFRELVWTGEIRQGDATRVVMLVVDRSAENPALPGTMPVTIRADKFWEGPERIIDAGVISNGNGQSWLVLLLPNGLMIQDRKSGSTGMMEIARGPYASRAPMGKLDFARNGDSVGFALASKVCTLDLKSLRLSECLPDRQDNGPASARYPLMLDLAPAGPAPPGKGMELVVADVCGGTVQFLAAGSGDYTEKDSLQLFQMDARGPIARSSELGFPGPIVEMHSSLTEPRIVVRNLATGNYEAYSLTFLCAQ